MASREQREVGCVTAVSRRAGHGVGKTLCASVRLLEGVGVEGDAHMGEKVQHRSRAARNPDLPNLRQVHLIHAELHDELERAGFQISAGQMGENITTRGIELLALPKGARLHFPAGAVVEVAGLRNPCAQLEALQAGLMEATLSRGSHGELIRKAGIMGTVVAGGVVRPGDSIRIEWPPPPRRSLEPV